MGFQSDLKLGKAGERFVKKVFKMNGVDIDFDEKARSDYDLTGSFNKRKLKVEVKFDKMACQTGNLAIEYHNPRSNKPSGLLATKSNLWAHVIIDDASGVGFMTAWLASTKNLKAYVDMYEPRKKCNFGGDKNASLWLYEEKHMLENVFTRIDNMYNEDKFAKLIRKLIK